MTPRADIPDTSRPDLPKAVCNRARRARDRRFDGKFFVAVKTTGIYCRPICPAPTSKDENVEYFANAAAAHEHGYRPCLRCRPEAAPHSPAWRGTQSTVARAIRLIEQGRLDAGSVADLATRLGVGERHLRRLFLQHAGASPTAIAQTRRIQLAKTLLNDTGLSMEAIALASGFQSRRRFQTVFRECYGKPPSALRKSPNDRSGTILRIELPYHAPLDWPALTRYFAARAIPGVEAVTDDCYRRNFAMGETMGWVEVSPNPGVNSLSARLHLEDLSALAPVLQGLRRQFDLDADIQDIHAWLRRSPHLVTTSRAAPGVRLVGAFDGFETTIRAVLGQQITVTGASTIAGRLVSRCGTPYHVDDALHTLFPTPAQLAAADLSQLGIPTARARTLRAVAEAAASGALILDGSADRTTVLKQLAALPGIGPWTTNYVAMRVLEDPDAFPSSDLGLRKALRPGETVDAKTLEQASQDWRPWRGYAAALLWHSLQLRP